MRVMFANQPGSTDRESEDWAGAGGSVAVVLDGLSTPGGHTTGCAHGTPWFVRHLGTALLRIAVNPEVPLSTALAVAIQEVAALHPSCDLASTATPSAAVAVVRVDQALSELQYVVLADVTVAVRGADLRDVHVVSDHRVDTVAQDQVKRALAAPIGSHEHSLALQELVAVQRRVRNTAEGYWIAGADPNSAEHAVAGRLAFPPGSEAALLTDGASCAVDLYEQLTDTEALDLLAGAGPSALLERVRAAERTDPDGRRWPRFKTSDDATALYLQR